MSSRIPEASSAFGWEAQSLHTMQWYRLVVGDGRLVYLARHGASWVV